MIGYARVNFNKIKTKILQQDKCECNNQLEMGSWVECIVVSEQYFKFTARTCGFGKFGSV